MLYAEGGIQVKTGEIFAVEVPAKSAPPAAPSGGKPASTGAPAESKPPAEPAKAVGDFPAIFKAILKNKKGTIDIFKSPALKDLSDDDICGLFTPEQQQQIKDFSESKLIPPHLFHGKVGKATIQQRILVAGSILTQGKNANGRPGDEPKNGQGKPRATCCGHFANWIWHYAGASPAGKTAQINQDYPSAVTGPCGAVFFGGLKYSGIPFDRRAGNPPLEPGDWLYVCYDKKDDPEWKFKSIGDHSVVFSHWSSPGQGIFFSQRFNEDQTKGYPEWSAGGGGDMHGDGVFTGSNSPHYYVSVIMRVQDGDFNILRTVSESKAVKKNAAWLDKNKIDLDKLHPVLVTQARERLKIVSDQKLLTDFLSQADLDPKKADSTTKYRLQARVCLAKEEAYKPIDPAQQELIKKIIDDAEKAKGGKDETLLSVTRLYALCQRLRLRWDSNGEGSDQNVDGLFESDFTWPGGKRKTVVWELLGFADKKAASAALWA